MPSSTEMLSSYFDLTDIAGILQLLPFDLASCLGRRSRGEPALDTGSSNFFLDGGLRFPDAFSSGCLCSAYFNKLVDLKLACFRQLLLSTEAAQLHPKSQHTDRVIMLPLFSFPV